MTWMSKRDLAAECGVNESTIYRWEKTGNVQRKEAEGRHPKFRLTKDARQFVQEVVQSSASVVIEGAGNRASRTIKHAKSRASHTESRAESRASRTESRAESRARSRASRTESRAPRTEYRAEPRFPDSRTDGSQWDVWADAAPGRRAPGPIIDGDVIIDIAIFLGTFKILCWAGGVSVSEVGRAVIPALTGMWREMMGKGSGKKRRKLPVPRLRARVHLPAPVQSPTYHTYH